MTKLRGDLSKTDHLTRILIRHGDELGGLSKEYGNERRKMEERFNKEIHRRWYRKDEKKRKYTDVI